MYSESEAKGQKTVAAWMNIKEGSGRRRAAQ